MKPAFSSMVWRLSLPVLIVLIGGCSTQKKGVDPLLTYTPKPGKARNIILLIGDGMALPQVSAHINWKKGIENTVFQYFPVVGFHKSFSADDLVTDSAAGATAFACGQKTENGMIGELPDKSFCTSILEEYAQKKYGTGIVVTCSAPHATPASFVAHQGLRAYTESIAEDYLHTPIDCFIGGGEYFFSTERPDKKNLKDTLRQMGYVVRRGTSLKKLPLDGSKPFMLFTADREPPTASSGRHYLPDATAASCDFLKKRRPNGFFLMVEGSQIDWACHANDRRWLQAEMSDFDKAIRKALEFAAADGETLVLVTGDHECGGLSLPEGETRKEFKPTFSARLHTGALVPVYAFGPQAELFGGIYDNTELFTKMHQAGILGN